VSGDEYGKFTYCPDCDQDWVPVPHTCPRQAMTNNPAPPTPPYKQRAEDKELACKVAMAIARHAAERICAAFVKVGELVEVDEDKLHADPKDEAVIVTALAHVRADTLREAVQIVEQRALAAEHRSTESNRGYPAVLREVKAALEAQGAADGRRV
jgi:hypothetical protein